MAVWAISTSLAQQTMFNQYAETAVFGTKTDKRGQKKTIEPETLSSHLVFLSFFPHFESTSAHRQTDNIKISPAWPLLIVNRPASKVGVNVYIFDERMKDQDEDEVKWNPPLTSSSIKCTSYISLHQLLNLLTTIGRYQTYERLHRHTGPKVLSDLASSKFRESKMS